MAEAPVRVNARVATNPTILELMRSDDSGRPVEEVVRSLARDKLAEADAALGQIDENWSPPPYDPILVAQALGIRCEVVDFPWLDDAMICFKDDVPTILYRRHRSRVRTCFNIFHEVAHTLFPDFQRNSLYQRSARPRLFEPEGQLEFLCDLAATEFLMPMDRFRTDLVDEGFSADRVASLCERYDASVEAVCLRMVESNVEECSLALVEHRQDQARRRRDRGGRDAMDMRVVYSVPSRCFRERELFSRRI